MQIKKITQSTKPKKLLPDGRPWGWCSDRNIELFKKYCSPSTRLVVDGGSFLGLSASELYKAAPAAKIICVDHWMGSPEHHRPGRTDIGDVIDDLFGTFCANMYERRDRISCLRGGSIDGMNWLFKSSLFPDLIYIDWSHDLKSVYNDTECAIRLFPKAVLVFDDWQRKGVCYGARNAIRDCQVSKRNLVELKTCAALEV